MMTNICVAGTENPKDIMGAMSTFMQSPCRALLQGDNLNLVTQINLNGNETTVWDLNFDRAVERGYLVTKSKKDIYLELLDNGIPLRDFMINFEPPESQPTYGLPYGHTAITEYNVKMAARVILGLSLGVREALTEIGIRGGYVGMYGPKISLKPPTPLESEAFLTEEDYGLYSSLDTLYPDAYSLVELGGDSEYLRRTEWQELFGQRLDTDTVFPLIQPCLRFPTIMSIPAAQQVGIGEAILEESCSSWWVTPNLAGYFHTLGPLVKTVTGLGI